MAHVELAERLCDMFEDTMYDDLADRRRVDGSHAYSRRWIRGYLVNQRGNIGLIVDHMIKDYEQNNALADLANPCDEQIREYLYDDLFGLFTVRKTR